MCLKELERINAMRITIAISDPEFALMSVRWNFAWEEAAVPHVPDDVLKDCLELQKNGNERRS